MTGKQDRSVEFDATVDEWGKITVPEGMARAFRKRPEAVHVWLTTHAFSDELRKRDVNEAEIDRIGKVQLETREQVVKFLLSEGILRRSGMTRRAR